MSNWNVPSTGVPSMAGRRVSKKDKIILLLKQGETSRTIIANKVGCDIAYISVVQNEFLRSRKSR